MICLGERERENASALAMRRESEKKTERNEIRST
jgi:hypothetical protein